MLAEGDPVGELEIERDHSHAAPDANFGVWPEREVIDQRRRLDVRPEEELIRTATDARANAGARLREGGCGEERDTHKHRAHTSHHDSSSGHTSPLWSFSK